MRDDLGNESECVNDSIVHDDTAPADVSLSISSGAPSVNTTSVTLTLVATDATEMYLTNSPGCTSGGAWEMFSTAKAWTLSASNTTASVYAKFRDSVGNESACIFDDIVHDNVPPSSTSILIESGASIVNSTSITLTLAATDAAQMYVTNTPGCAAGGVWENYTTSKAWTLAQANANANVYVKFRDSALNESACIFDDVLHDDIAPTSTSIVINNGDATASSTSVTLTLAATGATEMYITNAATCASGGVWEAYATTKAWTLPSTTTSEFVYVAFRDAAGNTSGCNSDSIGYAANAFVYGSTSESMLDGTPILCGGSPYCTSGSPWVIPDGAQIETLTIDNSAYVVIPADSTATIGSVVINGFSTLVVNENMVFESVAVTSGTLTGAAFAGSWDGSTWLPAPGVGNGHLILEVSGTLAVAAAGSINMNAKGYGCSSNNNAGDSRLGPGTHLQQTGVGGAGGKAYVNDHSAGGGGGASYGTSGESGQGAEQNKGHPSAVFGQDDFWTQLYLGPAGGGQDQWNGGGAGGGALKIVAGMLENNGIISSLGGDGEIHLGGGGAGGTLFVQATSFTGSGSFSVAGGLGDDVGGDGGSGRMLIQKIDESDNVLATHFSGLVLAMSELSLTTGHWNFSGANMGHSFISAHLAGGTMSNLEVFGSCRVLMHDSTGLESVAVTLHDSSTLTAGVQLSFGSISVNDTATLTASAFAGTWTSGAWDPGPGAGHGQLILSAEGTVSVAAGAKIHSDGRGYRNPGHWSSGGSRLGGGSSTHIGVGGAGGKGYSNDHASGGGAGASYGTGGEDGKGSYAGNRGLASEVFGDSDFWTQLYLGPAGGSQESATVVGGTGGGAIKITAENLAVEGSISSRGNNGGSGGGGGGAGGTIYLKAQTFSGAGSISVGGGAGTVIGGNGGSGRIRFERVDWDMSTILDFDNTTGDASGNATFSVINE